MDQGVLSFLCTLPVIVIVFPCSFTRSSSPESINSSLVSSTFRPGTLFEMTTVPGIVASISLMGVKPKVSINSNILRKSKAFPSLAHISRVPLFTSNEASSTPNWCCMAPAVLWGQRNLMALFASLSAIILALICSAEAHGVSKR